MSRGLGDVYKRQATVMSVLASAVATASCDSVSYTHLTLPTTSRV
ncbi:hypothetical protein JMUB7532_27600 [Staphylococcus aureus]